MRKSLENKIEKFVKTTKFPFAMYYTDCPINYNDDYYGDKYFFCYHGTHTIVHSFRNQVDLNDFLNEQLLEYKRALREAEQEEEE